MRVGTQNFLVKLDTFFDYIPVFSTITNLVDTIIRELVLSHKTAAEIENNRYFKHIKNKDDDWVTFIPFVGNAVFVFQRHFEDASAAVAPTPKAPPTDEKERILAAIKQDNHEILGASKLRLDKDFMQQVVEINGLLLRYAPQEVRQDAETAKKAVRQNIEALQYVGSRLRKDKDFMLELVRMNGLALKYCYCTGDARREIEHAAVKQNPAAKQWAYHPPAEPADTKDIIEDYKQNPYTFRYISKEAKNRIVTLLFTNQLADMGEQHRLYAADHALNNKDDFSDEIIKIAARLCIHNPQHHAFTSDAAPISLEYLCQATDVSDQDLLRAVSLIFSPQYSSNEDLLGRAISIADDWMLHNDNKEAIAKLVAKYPGDPFSPGVKQKAIEIAFWSDNSRFRSVYDEYRIEISTALVKAYPEEVLKKLYQNCFIPSPQTTAIRLTQLNDLTLQPQPEVVDQAGVARTFLTDLFESVKKQAESDDYKLLKFENIPGGALPAASRHTKEGKYKHVQPHMVSKLTEQELREAASLAYPSQGASLDVNQIRATFDRVQRAIDPLSDEEAKLYMLIGKLMGLCDTSNNTYVIGQIFDPVLYEVLHAIPMEELHNSYNELEEKTLLTLYEVLTRTVNPGEKRFFHSTLASPQELTDDLAEELLNYAYIDSDERPQALKGSPSLATVRAHFAQIKMDIKAALLEEAKQHATLKAIFTIAKGLASHCFSDQYRWYSLVWPAPNVMIERIQGVFSPELVKNSIQCANPTIKDYFTQWIDENSEDTNKLKDFLYVVTGSKSLATGSQLLVEEKLTSEQHLPQYHTCFRSIDAYEYGSYNLFKQKLEASIQESLASGFQRM